MILLCACGADEDLPTRPDLPADLFTACLTTPMRVVLEFASSDGLVRDAARGVGGVEGGVRDAVREEGCQRPPGEGVWGVSQIPRGEWVGVGSELLGHWREVRR